VRGGDRSGQIELASSLAAGGSSTFDPLGSSTVSK
jgi:hypothetical protein